MMRNKEKRNLIMSMALGDGCLSFCKNRGKVLPNGRLSLHHGIKQEDYHRWKVNLLEESFGRPISVGYRQDGVSVQSEVRSKKLRVYRQWTYPNGKKSLPKILKWISNPEQALTIWLMDDGYAVYRTHRLSDGTRSFYGGGMRLFINAASPSEATLVQDWINQQFRVHTKIKYLRQKEPFISFSTEDSLQVWEIVRSTVLSIPSMQHKFRHLENHYQKKLSQRGQSHQRENNIVQTST